MTTGEPQSVGIFDELDVARILERAAASDGVEPASGTISAPVAARAQITGALTLQAIEAIGVEAGFSATNMRAAALHVWMERTAPIVTASTSTGLVLRRRLTLTAPLDEMQWARLVAQLRELTSTAGAITTDGLLRSWTGNGLRVHMAPATTGTHWSIDIEADVGDQSPTIGAIFMAIGATIAVGAGSLVSARWIALGALLVGLGAVISGAGLAWRRRWRRDQHARIAQLTAALSASDVLVLPPPDR